MMADVRPGASHLNRESQRARRPARASGRGGPTEDTEFFNGLTELALTERTP